MGGGRNGRSRTQRKHFRQSRENVWKDSKSGVHTAWEPFATENTAFDEYYKEQGIVPPEEWDTFVNVLRTPLPAAFRINSSSQFYTDIRSQLENDFMKSLLEDIPDGNDLEAIKPLPWYPENLAWDSKFSRMQLRKNQALERFHEFLKIENEVGNITRQEAVSMIPPLFLNVHPDHFVLDMCAAPGSKTFQLLETIHRSRACGLLPKGMIVANDVDVQRCNLLIHQTKRISTANLIVSNNEAQNFPYCRLHRKYSEALGMGNDNDSSMTQLFFDRVLCDVPCSGDGTLRKAPDIWRKWNVGMGNGLHGLQIQIAMRGAALLKVGGRMVYSTCSMNPIENEAVVAELIRRCGGSIELIDVSTELPELIRRPGLKNWKVRDKCMWVSSYEDVEKCQQSVIFRSMLPFGEVHQDAIPVKHHGDVEDRKNACHEVNTENKNITNNHVAATISLCLERCVRIMPHDQNTGAFFIAVLHKLCPLPVIASSCKNDTFCQDLPQKGAENGDADQGSSDFNLLGKPVLDNDTCDVLDNGMAETIPLAERTEESTQRVGGKRKLQIQGRWKGVDPVVFFSDERIMNSIKDFYGIDPLFPFDGHLVTRNSDTSHVKRIYYISKSVKDVLELNFAAGEQLKITSVGLKMFERQTSKEGNSCSCLFRISSEGLPLVLPYITKQILFVSLVDLKHLLQYKNIKFLDFVDGEFGEKASNLMTGCCVVVLRDPAGGDAPATAIGCWKGRSSLSVMVTETDCQELLGRLLNRMEHAVGTKDNFVQKAEMIEITDAAT